jgi:hypothetical protein
MWCLADLEPGLEGLSMAIFTRILGWTKEETEVFLTLVRKDMKDTKIHSYWEMCVTSPLEKINTNRLLDTTSLDKSH